MSARIIEFPRDPRFAELDALIKQEQLHNLAMTVERGWSERKQPHVHKSVLEDPAYIERWKKRSAARSKKEKPHDS